MSINICIHIHVCVLYHVWLCMSVCAYVYKCVWIQYLTPTSRPSWHTFLIDICTPPIYKPTLGYYSLHLSPIHLLTSVPCLYPSLNLRLHAYNFTCPSWFFCIHALFRVFVVPCHHHIYLSFRHSFNKLMLNSR